jgi:dephospho-CoA kinase
MNPIRIALTGGIATGKSTVARMFEELGAVILDADQVARDVVKPGADCFRRLFDIVGPEFFDREGELKRRKLRERIIEDKRLRAKVNAVLHPSIAAAMDAEWKKRQIGNHGQDVVIFDIPLLFESRLQDRFQLIVLVYTPRNVQMERLMERDGLTEAQAENTLSMQWPIEKKRGLSHLVIDNSGGLAETRRQVAAVWQQIVSQMREVPAG